jgi:glycosyltransferase involved in cell wall biosynthesis
MDVEPKISVITASKNGGRFLRQTIDSVLRQNFTDYEHVVVDSASTDNTVEILREYESVRWISEPDAHADEGFYKAAAMARGRYIMLSCVSDSYSDPNWFGRCAEILDGDPEVSLVYGLPRQMTEDGSPGRIVCANYLEHPPPQKTEFFPFWLGAFSICPESTFCVRAEVFRECFPKYEPTGYFLPNHALLSFNYNFNTKGYLPYFLPVVASCGRYHHDSNSIRLAKMNRVMKKQYERAVIKYANEVLSGKRRHVFRDGTSNVIRMIEPGELDLCRKKVLDYRINRRTYLGKKHGHGRRYWIRKLKIIAAYSLFGQRIYN